MGQAALLGSLRWYLAEGLGLKSKEMKHIDIFLKNSTQSTGLLFYELKDSEMRW